MKVYRVMIGGLPHTIQYPEGEQPEGAVEVKAAKAPPNKARAPKNKKATHGTAAAADPS